MYSSPKLMKMFEQYGLLLGYKVNIGNIQLLSNNYSLPEDIKNKYPLTWQTKSIGYLGINIPKDFTKLSEYNYLPVKMI